MEGVAKEKRNCVMRFYAACEAALTRIAAPDVRICHAITRRMVCGTGDEILCNPVVVGVTMTLVRSASRKGTVIARRCVPKADACIPDWDPVVKLVEALSVPCHRP